MRVLPVVYGQVVYELYNSSSLACRSEDYTAPSAWFNNNEECLHLYKEHFEAFIATTNQYWRQEVELFFEQNVRRLR